MFRLIFSLALCGCFNNYAHVKKMELNKALKSNFIRVEAKSLGGHQGYCVGLTITNLTKDSLQISLEPGTLLKALEEKYQDILVTKQETIRLKRLEKKSQTVLGYCCQASDCSPRIDSKFSVGFHSDSNLVTLARYLNTNPSATDVEQHAIWAISNKHVTANIISNNEKTNMPLLQLVSALKHEELPWYQIRTRTRVYKSGAIEVIPIELSGELTYTISQKAYASLSIKNKSGQKVCYIKCQWLETGPNRKYDLKVPLQGLTKGEYTIELNSNGNELANRKFEI